MGSKNRIAKHILPIILKDRKENQYYVEPFVGGANMIDKVDGNRIGGEFNKYIANIVNVTADRVSKIISSLRDKNYIKVKLKYKTDSKEIEERQILPIVENINRCSQKHLEGIDINNYSDSQKQPYPIGDNDKDIINNIKNKNNYNKEDTHKKKNIPYRSDRYGDDFNWDSLYANYKEISATSNV